MSDFCPICNRPLCRTALGDSTDYEQRAACYRLGYERVRDEVNEQREAKDAAYAQIYKMLSTLEGCDDALARIQGHGCQPSDDSVATLRKNIRAVMQRDSERAP